MLRQLTAGLIAVALAAGGAAARSEKTLSYPRDAVWSTMVRFLVVDEHVKVLEKDGDAGYVTFEIKDDGKVYRGSMEVMTIIRERRGSVRFVLQIEDRPDWMEIAMLARLERKLRQELGSPSPGPQKEAPKEDAPKDAPRSDDGPPIVTPKNDGPPVSSKP